jgi:hypothetical protein
LREVICPVLELREEKRTFVKVGGGKVDFFLLIIRPLLLVSSSVVAAFGPAHP